MKKSACRMMNILFVTITSILAMKVAMAQDPVEVSPLNHTVLFENDRVRVLDYHSNPGDKSLTHSHPDYLVYDLADGYQVRLTSTDGTEKAIEGKAGSVTWHEATTHAVENIGTTNAHALVIELKK
ncbi:MAG: cytoplasmic protein [Gammaproteobacteria bacterium]|nr:cytoplasmic protein [Gammaproteobacteria bacterium]